MATLVLVKGDKRVAAKAAAAREVPFVFRREVVDVDPNDPNYQRVDTLGLVDDAFTQQVCDWFCESPNTAPYPPGACLHYQLNYVEGSD